VLVDAKLLLSELATSRGTGIGELEDAHIRYLDAPAVGSHDQDVGHRPPL
jgi:hypothetical protein